ncbi:major facilitator superfamily domain-containing protein [Mycena olivaceomarginata]|nr:major facilitator superfamily domain-containing protein [Mycena olivaceomarginata]
MDARDESPKSSDAEAKKDLYDGQPSVTEVISVHSGSSDYRLYKRRFVVLNIVSGMTWPWFGPISNDMVAQFGITLDQVNWLGNVMACIYLPVSLAVPEIIRRYGIRRCCDIGAATLLISAWIRYAGTVHSLSSGGAYALLFVGQFFAAIAQPIFQVIGPKYSETWFDLKGRTTATMILAIANPIGGALGQLLSPIVGNTRQSILVLGIMSSVAAPFVFLISAAPPTPPTYSASKKAPGILSLLRVIANKGRSTDPSMTFRERIDFTIVFFVFGVLSSASVVQFIQPVGYSSDTAGFMGATLILSGIVAAVVTAPLFDRVFTSHLAITAKFLVPILAVAWLCFIWVVKPNNAGAVYALCAIVGIANADGSSALLWFACNGFAIIFILVEGALRAGPNANPPLNMRNALIFNGVVVMATSSSIFFLRGRQTRKQLDQEKRRQSISLQTRPPAESAGEA